MSNHVPNIVAKGICFSYRGATQALQDLDFSAEPGEFIALTGANGSGKTTLMKILLHLLEPQSGTVQLDGRDIRKLSAAELYQNVGMIFQNPCDQLFAPTVEEDVAFGPRNLGLAPPEVQDRVQEALEATEATHLGSRPIHHLSFGEQKRVCLAGVLAMRPNVLLMDEPTAGLDPNCERHMIELLSRLNRQQGLTIIMATHSVDLLPLLARRLVVLSRGKLLAEGPLEQIFGDSELIRRAGLRLPFVSQLFEQLRNADGVPFEKVPLTVGEARSMLLQRLAGPVTPAKGGPNG
jgi:cobalt/nickel transport system ATP-binding protein